MRLSASAVALLSAAAAALVVTSPVVAGVNGSPASKATAQVGDINLVSGPTVSGQYEGAWATVLRSSLKTPNMKDIFVGVSMEVGLYTETTVRSKGGDRDTSIASASVQVRVLVDGQEASPGTVVFGRRMQTLSAVFQGLIDGALSVDPTTGQIVINEDLLQPEEVTSILETMDAHSFNFVLADLPPGLHQVEVQARIDLGEQAQAGSAVAKALIGKGSMTVEEVRMVRSAEIALD